MKIPKVTRLPSDRYFVRLRLNGQTYSRTCDTEKEAEAWALSIKAQYKANQLKQKLPDEQKTVRTIVQEYVDSSSFSRNTRTVYRVLLEHHFSQVLDKPFCEVRNWQKYVNLELQRNHPNTVRMMWARIAASLRFHDLPVPPVKIPKKAYTQKNYLTAEQIPIFMDAIKGTKYEVLFLMMLCSMRVSEALAVRPEDITEQGIHVRGTKTDASDRIIPWMIPRIKELPLVPSSHTTLSKHLKRICRENNLPELSCHGLRISFASLCYSKGVPDRICMKVAGWSSIQTMHSVYVRISEADVQKHVSDLFR